MGIVYLAVVHGPAGFQKLHVIKELKPELAEDPTFLRMFMEEARLAARLNHPNIVQTFEVGSEGSRHFIAMEYLEGRTLNRVVRRFQKAERPLTLGMHLRIIREILRGLDYAHNLTNWDGSALGIIHRDVSPPNVFLTFDGQIKLVDFGVAKAADSSLETKTGMVKGKVTYMAPEQIQGSKLDARADVFAVGVMLWEALCGRRMWAGKGELEVLTAVVKEDVPTPISVVPEIPRELNDICMRALACNRDNRYGTAAELEAALEQYAIRQGIDVGTREIAHSMTQLFADERKQVNAEIEAYLSRALGGAMSANVPAIATSVAGNATRTPSGNSGDRFATSASEPQIVSVPSVPSHAPERIEAQVAQPMWQRVSAPPPAAQRPQRSFVPWILGATALIAAGVLGLTIARRPSSAPAAASTAPATDTKLEERAPSATPPVSPTASPTASPTVDGIEVTVRVSPSNAQIAINDTPVSGNPFVGRFRKSDGTLRVKASARGYVTRTEEIPASESGTVTLSLERVVEQPRQAFQPHAPPPPTHAAPTPAPPPPPPPAVDTPKPAATPTAAPTDVNPSGGKQPHRPIDTSSPY